MKFRAVHETQRFTTIFIRTRQLSLLSQINPLYTFPLYFSKIHYNIILPYTSKIF